MESRFKDALKASRLNFIEIQSTEKYKDPIIQISSLKMKHSYIHSIIGWLLVVTYHNMGHHRPLAAPCGQKCKIHNFS